MKKILFISLMFVFFLCGCSKSNKDNIVNNFDKYVNSLDAYNLMVYYLLLIMKILIIMM